MAALLTTAGAEFISAGAAIAATMTEAIAAATIMGAAYGIDELRRRFALAIFGEWRCSCGGHEG